MKRTVTTTVSFHFKTKLIENLQRLRVVASEALGNVCEQLTRVCLAVTSNLHDC